MRRFRPALAPSLAVAMLLPLFLLLGYWQLQRAEEKRVLQAEYDSRARDAAVRIESRLQREDELRFYRVSARGYYEPAHQVLLDNRVHRGQVGYHVVTPLRIENSEVRVLVNRGWIALGTDRSQWPVVETPAGRQEITGVATVPSEKAFMLQEPEPLTRGWQTVWQHLDMQRFRAAVPFRVQPVVVLLDPQSPGGFAREWARLDAGIAVHQGYAFQWFILALALAALYVFLTLRRPGNTKGNA